MKHSGKSRNIRRVVATAVAGGLAITMAACSSSGGAQTQTSSQDGNAAGQATTPRMTIAMITHAVQGDNFWDLVQKGAAAAAAKDNVDLQYAGDADGANQATLVQNAIDRKVDGIALTLAKPDAMADAMAKATAAGIPVVVFNSGLDDWKQMGGLAFFGLDMDSSGVMEGEQLANAGGKHGICVIQEQGQVVLEALCDGATQGFATGSMDKLYVDGSSMASVQATITAQLQSDPSIDSIVTLGAPVGLAAMKSKTDAGSSAKITSLNMTPDLVEPIRSGEILATIDQQGWLQGYQAVDSLWLYKTNQNIVGSGVAVLTGPTLVNKDNIDQVAPLVEAGTR